MQAVDSMGAALQDLHLALGNAEAACAVAVARAQRDQAAGNYKVTHTVWRLWVGTWSRKVPSELC